MDVVAYSTSANKVLTSIAIDKVDIIITDLISDDLDATEISVVVRTGFPDTRLVVNGSFHPGPLIKPLLKEGVCTYFIKNQMTPTKLEELVHEVFENNFCYTSVVTHEVILNTWLLNEHSNMPELSEREEDVLLLICNGLTKVDIAERLFISESTVKYHTQNLFEKSKVATTVEMVLKAINSGWVSSIELKKRFRKAV